ncbi:ABC transporter ATP-binding protein [Acuticoccus kandeliae]|uniref:ABC transporter ATP-binding protein n=1 Tax=Acuticoccus kandeliae TaxID=2073160 RepID=UPI00196B0C22|nr:ABC transporter ATP-binding protein [Acuticoccus kandeliae]
MRDDLIVVDRLTKRYGQFPALLDVNLRIKQGEFLALLGPSGCGKTTLLRTIAGFVDPTEGEILIEGTPMSAVPPNRRPVNTVFQHYALFPHMTVAENIAFGPRRKRQAKAEIAGMVEDALEMVGMGGYGDRRPGELSGGQQQRIALARAIINRPKVLLLDEPLGALDLKLRKRMQIELKRLHEQLGMTFVFVTHDQEEALVMADRIAVMEQGRLSQLGTGEEIYRQPNSRYVADFIGEANLLDCTPTASGGVTLTATGQPLPYSAAGATEPTLMIRPECIELGAGGEGAVTISGTVRDRMFLGASVRLMVVLAEGVEIAAQPHAVADVERLEPGQSISLHWRTEDGRILPA